MSVSISGAGSISGLDQGFNVTTGSVGVGTDNPTVKLDIVDSGSPNIALRGSSCLLYTSPSPRDATLSRMPSSA